MIICLADPSSTFRRRIRNALNGDTTYQYTEVECGQDLLVCLQDEEPPSIIIIRDELGDMAGIDATRAIREIEDHVHTPIFLLSSSATHVEVLQAVECGVDIYIILPLDEDVLADKVGRAAERVRTSATTRRRDGYTREQIL